MGYAFRRLEGGTNLLPKGDFDARHHRPGSSRVLDLIEAGRSVTDVVRDLGISGQAICTWLRQDRIDRGLVPGLNNADKEELAAANGASPHLEMELRATGRRSSWSERRCVMRG